ncbi:MAG: hypothetical protein HOI35_05940 [Woeseia sp.]|jgi:hypothetical protein|nr:hypothetical protein [Woeseia sp.]MBT6209543.1 hypothetical protein [Woeseia sp.]
MRNVIFACLLLIVAACGGPPGTPEDVLRTWVTNGEVAAEEKNRSELLNMISKNYVDARGNDRKQIGDLLRIYFFRQNSLALLTSIDSIEVSGETAATVTLTIGMAGTKDAGLGISADAYKFEFELVKPDEDWLLIGARWAELGQDLR